MKIVYPVCCGVDVHKKMIVGTIASTNKNGVTDYLTETFTTLNRDLFSFRDWLASHNCNDVCMESTGKYWIPVFNILEQSKIHVLLTHPMYVRAIKGKKTDKKDSKWIADLFKHDLVYSSFIPPPEIRALRELSRYRYKLVGSFAARNRRRKRRRSPSFSKRAAAVRAVLFCMRSSEKNRFQDCMTISNIGLASVLSDPFGKTAQDVMKQVLASSVFDAAQYENLIYKSAKKKTELILASIKDCRIESDQRFKMSEVSNHVEYLEQSILRTEAQLYARIQPYMPMVTQLAGQIPGISQLSVALILSEIGVDMSVFPNAKHMVSWAGLAPTNNQSAGKKKSVRISKAGQFLKPLLVQCALAAVKDKKQPYFAIKYAKIKKRRGHKKAIIAIARMMLTCVFHMLSTGEAFNPSDLLQVTKPAGQKKQHITEQAAIAFLAEQGYDVASLTKLTASEHLSVNASDVAAALEASSA